MRVEYTLVVVAEAGDRGEAAMRLKGLLKVALRGFGMRCLNVSETRVVPSAVRRERVGESRGGGAAGGGWGDGGAGYEWEGL